MTVNKSGTVRAKKKGNATVAATVTYQEKGRKKKLVLSCKITVRAKASGSGSDSLPKELLEIPSGYLEVSDQPGILERLDYTTYESFSYEQKSRKLEKTAYVYLPHGYDKEKQYDVFYLMHGGWSNETTTLGTPSQPSEFKNVLDHAIADGRLRPLIVVCPTYNNTNENGQDSDSYSLAMQLTKNYHNELSNDLIPAVEGTYSTYAKSTAREDLIASREHRGFGG